MPPFPPTPIYTWVMWPYSPLLLRSHYPSPNQPIWPMCSLTLTQPPCLSWGPNLGVGEGRRKGRKMWPF